MAFMRKWASYFILATIFLSMIFYFEKGLALLLSSSKNNFLEILLAIFMFFFINLAAISILQRSNKKVIIEGGLVWKIRQNKILRYSLLILLVFFQFVMLVYGLSENGEMRSLIILLILPAFISAALIINKNT